MSCREAIEVVLRSAGEPLTARVIAEEIERRGLYRRADGQPLPAYQVASVVHSAPLLESVGGRIWFVGASRPGSQEPRPEVHIADDVTAVLVGCVSRKERFAAPARDLYRSRLFAGRRAHAERSGKPWLIVSAHHGVVDPDQVIEPYDVRLSDLTWPQRHELSERVAQALEERFGELAGQSFEVHAGSEYVQMLGVALKPRGARTVVPLRGLRIGEQLAWYGRNGHVLEQPNPSAPVAAARRPGLALRITQAFCDAALDLSARAGAPPPGWAGMPEVVVADRMRAVGASSADVRLLLTLTSAMDRARDADRLWFSAERLWLAEPWTFDPQAVVKRGLTELGDCLRSHGVSQRHGLDIGAWRVIAESLADPAIAPELHRAVYDGEADAQELLRELQLRTPEGGDRFPFLRGPKVGPMWIRMLAHPGGAVIDDLAVIPVAVDVQVRKISEYLGVTDTGGLDLDPARPVVQTAWRSDVDATGAVGPGQLDGTCAALDPALWFWAKWGCTRCEQARRKLPIADVCSGCRFPARR